MSPWTQPSTRFLSRRSRIRTFLSCSLAGSALALTSCANLEVIKPDACGNGVVEPEVGEDCDGQAGCGRQGTANACLYLCEWEKDRLCPAGFSCGVDSVCRAPTGTFELLSATTTVTALDLLTGDVNSDGCHEIIHTTRRSSTLTALGSRSPGLCSALQQELPSGNAPGSDLSHPAPVLADVTGHGDGKVDLLRPGAALFGDGLFVHVAGLEPRVASSLYSTVRLREELARPLKVRWDGKDALLLLINHPLGMDGKPSDGVGIAGVTNPINRAMGLMASFQGGLEDMAFVQAAELGPSKVEIGGKMADSTLCDEVVLGVAGAATLTLYGVYKDIKVLGDGTEEKSIGMVKLKDPVALDGGARLRERNAVLAIVDHDGDGTADLIVNATDDVLHIAYGVGDGRFDSHTPPNSAAPDQKTSILPLDYAALAAQFPNAEDLRFIARKLTKDDLAPEVHFLPCPPSEVLESPTCNPTPGGCEEVVLDIDKDGIADLVTTEEQQPGLILQRGGVGATAHISYLDTQCPPHNLTVGDFDNDAIDDVAFFDQASDGYTGDDTGLAVTSLKILYGKAFAEPSEPEDSGRFDLGNGLTAGRFVPGAPATQLYAARSIVGDAEDAPKSSFALIEGYGERQLFAPFYFPQRPPVAGEPAPPPDRNLYPVSMLAATAGHFLGDEATSTANAVALLTEEVGTGGKRLWNIQQSIATASLSPSADALLELPECNACVLLPVNLDKDAAGIDELVLLSDSEAIVYTVSPGNPDMPQDSQFFVKKDSFPTTHRFKSVDTTTHPQKYVPRPLVADLDGDTFLDVVARADDGALAVLWGKADGRFDEGELLPASGTNAGESCGKCSVALLDFNVDDAPQRKMVVVGPGKVAFYGVNATTRKLEPFDPTSGSTSSGGSALPVPEVNTDFTAVAAADLDGDGVEDLVIMPNASFIFALRGVPVHE